MQLLSWSPGTGTWVDEKEIIESIFDLEQVLIGGMTDKNTIIYNYLLVINFKALFIVAK